MASYCQRIRPMLSLCKRNPKITYSFLSNLSLSARLFSSNFPSQFKRIGFIGLGNMGSRMCDNLIKAGYSVAIHDVNLQVMKMFSEKGILTKESPMEVATESDVVITMLPSSSHVLDVYTGPKGLLNGRDLLRPWLFIDSSTIDPQTSRKLSMEISGCTLKRKEDGWETPAMLDAPVSGGVLAAETGSLTFMVGGTEEAYMAAKPLFLSMGKNTIYCGGAGNGSTAKICNNLAMAVSMLGVSEAFALGQSLGITASTLTKIFNSSSARCWSRGTFSCGTHSLGDDYMATFSSSNTSVPHKNVTDSYNPVPGVMDGVPASRNYDGGFASKLMAKDLKLASASAKEVGLKFPLTSVAEEIFTELSNTGYGAKDFSCVFQYYYSGKEEM